MGLGSTQLLTDGAYIPVTGFVTEPIAAVVMGGGSQITADVAVGITAIIIVVEFKIFLIFAAAAGIPVASLVTGPLGFVLMNMALFGGEGIAAGQTDLGFFFRGRRTGIVISQIQLLSAGGAGMPVT